MCKFLQPILGGRCTVHLAFSVAGPTVWNSLPGELRDRACGFDSFKQFLKTILLVSTNVTSALEVFFKMICAI